jgi:hypothetical protein
MTKAPESPRLAVLIDAENISAKFATELFSIVTKIGDPILRRIYGNFANGHLGDWAEPINRHALKTEHVPSVSGKNSTDLAMAIDAIDILHAGLIEGFCLVTSDRDFTRLAIRIREAGLVVHGFGEAKTANGLVSACTQFHCLSSTVAAKPPAAKVAAAKQPATKPAASKPQPAKPAVATPATSPPAKPTPADTKTAQVAVTKAPVKAPTPPPVKRYPHRVWPLIEAAMPADVRAWVPMSAVAQVLNKANPDYLMEAGFSSLKALLTALSDHFELGVAEDGTTAQVRRRLP